MTAEESREALEGVDWLLEQLADSSARAFAVKFLEDHPELLERWFPVLFSARLLTVPPPTPTPPGAAEADWPAGRLLEVAARRRVPGILEALEAVPECGPNATRHLLQAFSAISDPAAAAQLVPSAVRWLSNAPGMIYDVPALSHKLVLLASSGYQNEAAQLLNALLAYKDFPVDLGSRWRAEAKITDFWLRYLIENALPQIGDQDLPWLAWRLELKLREVQEWEVADIPELAPPALLHSFYLVPVSDLGGSLAHFDELVAWGLTRTILRLTGTSPQDVAPFLHRWLPERLLILRRIALHVLSEHGALFHDLLAGALSEENVGLDDCFSEFWRFLHSQFPNLEKADQQKVEEWILSSTEGQEDAHRRYRWLSAINNHLSPPTAEAFQVLHEQFGDESNLDRLVTMSGVRMLEPTSPVDQATLAQWAVSEIVRYCLHYVGPEEAFDAASKEGLAGALEAEIARRPSEFCAEASAFEFFGAGPRESPRYVQALFLGLHTALQEEKTRAALQDEETRDDSADRWTTLLEATLSANVTNLILWLDGRNGSPRGRFVPVWEDVRRAAADLLLDSLEAALRLQPPILRGVLAGNEHGILEALAALQRATDPDAGRDSDDPLTTAINSTRGRALFAVIAFMRCWAISRREDPESKAFELHPGAMELLTRRLAEETAPAVRCVYGWRLPFLFAVAREWLQQNLPAVLPREDDAYRIWRATWDAYVAFNQLYEDLWSVLSAEYLRATQRLGERWYEGHPPGEVDRHLGSHIFLAWFLDLEGSEPILASLLTRSDDDLRASLASFGALVIRDQIVGKGLGPQSVQWLRLREYWRARLVTKGVLGEAPCERRERVAFVRWLEHVPEPLPAIADLVRVMLDGFDPAQDWEVAELLEYLADQGGEFPLDAIQTMLSLADVSWPRWLTNEQEQKVFGLLGAAAQNDDTAELVGQLVGLLAQRYQLFSYRKVLGES